jgi:hypothetical protein
MNAEPFAKKACQKLRGRSLLAAGVPMRDKIVPQGDLALQPPDGMKSVFLMCCNKKTYVNYSVPMLKLS